MGWKASCLFFTTREDGYFGTFPAHHPDYAREIITELGLGTYEPGEPASLERGIYPMDKRLYIGAYDEAAVIAAKWVSEQFLDGKTPELVSKIEAAMPGAKVLAIGLNEVTNYFGYAWFESGKLVRCRSGSADTGMTVNHGEPLTAEKPLLAKLRERDGERYYVEVLNGEPTDHTEEDMGEDLVFEVSRSMLGCRLDEFKLSKLALEAYRPKTGFLSRLFGRG